MVQLKLTSAAIPKKSRSSEFEESSDTRVPYPVRALPRTIQQIAREKYALLLSNPSHPSLHAHELADDGRGRHRTDSRLVAITHRYRAIYVTIGDLTLVLDRLALRLQQLYGTGIKRGNLSASVAEARALHHPPNIRSFARLTSPDESFMGIVVRGRGALSELGKVGGVSVRPAEGACGGPSRKRLLSGRCPGLGQ
jgi:hypothetical protein